MCFPDICGVLLSPSDKTSCVLIKLDLKSAKEALTLPTVVCCSWNTRDFLITKNCYYMVTYSAGL